ncbi:MAG: DNA-processing protein DprA [Thermodesulfobacteriota bacterium]
MESLLPWLVLKNIPGIGNHIYKRLIDQFRSPDRVLAATDEELLSVNGMTGRLVSAIRRHQTPDSIRRELDLTSEKGFDIIPLTDPDFPALLLQIPDPPPYLYLFGSLKLLKNPIAVVGSRNATDYGVLTTRRLSADLATRGITIVSGMAIGIDTAAHQGALSVNGQTVAVLGSGLDYIYPRENKALFYEIAKHGAVVSEFPLKEEPKASNFPQRNRIISGMSLGTVIVEAAKQSGSLITARLAAEQGREVFAVPGSIRSFKSAGTHGLIKQGAKLVEHAGDIIEELSRVMSVEPQPESVDEPEQPSSDTFALSGEEIKVIHGLEPYPIHIDDLARKVAMDSGKLAAILLKLEIHGIVRQSPGKRFTKIER